MRVRQATRPILLLGAVTLLSVAAAGAVAVLNPPLAAVAKPASLTADQTPVRVVGTPFIPNTNPRER